MSNGQIVLDESAVEFLQEEVGGGSTVVANPELVGDEPDLTGLEVDGNKYKVPQGGGVEYIQVNIGGGTLTAEQLTKVFDNGVVKEGVFFIIDNIILISSGQPREQVFNSTVINGKYYSMEVDEFTGVYTITEISVGGGGTTLYRHWISIEWENNSNTYLLTCFIISSKSTSLSLEEVKLGLTTMLPTQLHCEAPKGQSGSFNLVGICRNAGGGDTTISGFICGVKTENNTSTAVEEEFTTASNPTIVDNVTQI